MASSPLLRNTYTRRWGCRDLNSHDEVGNHEGSGKEEEDLVVQPSRNAAAQGQGLREDVQGV